VLASLFVWSEVICIWSSWCHCHPVVSCFIKIKTALIFLVLAYPACPWKQAVERSVCGYMSRALNHKTTSNALFSTSWWIQISSQLLATSHLLPWSTQHRQQMFQSNVLKELHQRLRLEMLTWGSAIAEWPHNVLSAEMLSTAARLYKKSQP